MTVGTLAPPAGGTTFPATSVEATLRSVLLESAKSTAELHGIQLPASLTQQYAATVALDSLDVVSSLCDIEPIVGFELKDSLIKAGGYHSIDDAINHLMSRIQAAG